MNDCMRNKYVKLLSRYLLEELSNKCARLELYNRTSDEYLSLYSELCSEAEEVQSMNEFTHTVSENSKVGVINLFMNCYIVPPFFDKILCEVNCGYNYIVAIGGKYGIVQSNNNGSLILPCIYDNIEPLNRFEDIVKIELDGKYGVVCLYGGDFARITIEPIYDSIEETDSGFIILKKSGKYGVYKSGYILPAEYERIFIPVVLGWVKVLKDSVWGYVDADKNFTTDINKAYLYSE